MDHLWVLTITLFLCLTVQVISSQKDAPITTESLIKENGYPFEAHTVKTDDGYILTLHRIPSLVKSSTPAPVVFLMHGVMCSSSDWLLLGPKLALPYLLADAGYDVWLGNTRGNTYSKHVSLNTSSNKYWDFSWHEIALLDLPVMFDYVKALTGVKKFAYVGHSQGTTVLLVLNSYRPDLKNTISSAHFLSPVAYMKHASSPFYALGGPEIGKPNPDPSNHLKEYEALIIDVKNKVCDEKENILCTNPIYASVGFNNNTIDPSIFDLVMATSPSTASLIQVVHYMQLYKSGFFRPFDYGYAGNLMKYKSITPPSYCLNKVNVPLFMYYAAHDAVAAVEDVDQLMSELTTKVHKHYISDPLFDHMSIQLNKKAKEYIYDILMKNILLY